MPKLRIRVTHTHAGVVYPAGHILDVDEFAAKWMTDRSIAAIVTSDGSEAQKKQAVKQKRIKQTTEGVK